MRRVLLCALALASVATGAFGQCFSDPVSSGAKPSDFGIVVQSPKVYDDYFLETQLAALKTRLASINVADQGTLLGKIGQLQGATLSQSGLAIQAMGPGTSTVSTLTPPASLPGYALPSSTSTTAASPISLSGAYGTTTTGAALTPSVPAVSASSLSLPSSYAPSSLDTLNEEMQLSAQIMNFELLLDGALNDRYIPGTQVPKKRVTVGLNISIEPCLIGGSHYETKHLLKDRLAEVEIEIQNASGSSEKPSIVTLLPRDKTYNVASLSDKSISVGAGGVLGGVLSVGGNWLWHKQRYYLVQEQDTVAIDESTPSVTKFVWQFRPVLRQGFVSAGTRQNFIQFSLPAEVTSASCAKLVVKTRWRKLDTDTGIIGTAENETAQQELSLPYFDLSDPTQLVTSRDIGGGLLDVRIDGAFQEGSSVRVGGVTLSNGSPNFSSSTSSVEFIASANDVISGNAFLVTRDGSLSPIRSHASASIPQCGAKGTTSSPDFTERGTLSGLTIQAYSDAQSLVTVNFKENQIPPPTGSDPRVNPIIASIGGKVFGLQGSSFRTIDPATSPDGMAMWTISIVVPTDLIQSSDKLYVQRIFVAGDSASTPIPLNQFPKSDLAISDITVVSTATTATPVYRLLVTGSGLDKASLGAPTCAKIESKAISYLFMTIPNDTCKASAKVLVLTNGDAPPVVASLPKLDAPDTPKPAAVDPLKSTVAPTTGVLTLTGSGLDSIKSVKYGKTVLAEVLSLDKKSANVLLTPDITATEGIRYLDITTTDDKHLRFELTVKKP
jgi:hypothetical protein